MFCVNCGKQLIPNTKFCGGCGYGIESSKYPEPTVSAIHQVISQPTVSVMERLLASIGFTTLFVMLLSRATLYSTYAAIFMIYQARGLEESLHISDVRISTLLPSVVISVLISWWLMPRIISDYKSGASLKLISGRFVTLIACIAPLSVFFGIERAYNEGLTVLEILTPAYFISVGIWFLLTVPFMYKVIRASLRGKLAKAITIYMFTITFIIEFVAPDLLFIGNTIDYVREIYPFSATVVLLTFLLPRIIPHIITGGLTVFLSIVSMAIMCSFKKTS
jgi:hypothetical protein